jgi:glyoxylase-like metal-dependent hydrolase (beta-lactamase superfamily II)
LARLAERLPQNAPGEFFVDSTCIDCDACRQIAPDTFAADEDLEKSFVQRQPATPALRKRAAMALVACPTASIGTTGRANTAVAIASFPEEVLPGISYCGFTSESSFGASSWFVEREAGNVLVDSPRAAEPLLRRIAAKGGVRTMFLTHRDDVADHAKFHARFDCERVLHRADVTARTARVERPLEGSEPVRLAPDQVAIPVPGHTRGSAALLLGDHVLFTGDHLWWSPSRGRLHASRGVCWYSWSEQTRSMERLLDFRFEWILPGHGRPWHAPSAAAMHAEIESLVRRMRA